MHQNSINGNQANDPEKGALAMISAAENEHPPLHLFLGQDAFDLAFAKMDMVKADLEQWKSVSVSTGF